MKKMNKISKIICVNLKPRLILSLFLCIITLFFLISMFTFNPDDLSWFNYNSDSVKISNKLGYLGSNLSFALLYLLGPSSLIFLIFLSYITVFLFSKNKFKLESDRFIAFFILIFVSSFLFEYHKIKLFNYEGILGKFIYNNIFHVFDKKIIFIWVYSFLFISFVLLFRFSFIHVCRFIKLKKVAFCIKYFFKFIKVIVATFLKITVRIFDFFKTLLNPSPELNKLLFEEEYGHLISINEDEVDEDFWNNFLNKTSFEKNIVTPTIKFNEKKMKETEYQIDIDGIFEISNDITDKKIIKDSDLQVKVLEEKLKCFGVFGSVVSIKYGPVITLFEYEPHIDTKISKIIALEDDLAMALQTTSIRIIAPIPGKSVVGFEIANKIRRNILMSQVIKSPLYKNSSFFLPLIFGEDTIGNKAIFDLVKMPHLLIAGSTGSGKSIALNSMIISLLCKCNPNVLKLILIDPKRLEFTPYNEIAHLLFPIITLPQQAIFALKWLIKEMENRYDLMSRVNSKNIFDFNDYCKKNGLKELPFIVVVIDELADLMITAGREIEDSIIRIAQMARASGIHMIVATQRPSVDIITGLIKVNFPSRLSFKVASKIDSRTILDCAGAEKLLGKGDMLFQNSQSSHLERFHGAYVTDEEISKVIDNIKSKYKVEYLNLTEISSTLKQELSDADDQLYKDIISYLNEIDEVSISLLQRRFKIGYNRSARIIEMLESQGYILPSENNKPRKVNKAYK